MAVCSEQCLHGLCVAPDQCKCETGYGGPNCGKSKEAVFRFVSCLNVVSFSVPRGPVGQRLHEQV